MKKFGLFLLYFGSINSALISLLWLLAFGLAMLTTGGKYSYVDEHGSRFCGLSLFGGDDWLWVAFNIFGVPLLIFIASIRTLVYCHKWFMAK